MTLDRDARDACPDRHARDARDALAREAGSAAAGFLELRCGATLGSVRVLNELLDVALRALAVDEALRHDVTLGLAELVANVCVHEYAGAPGEVAVRLDASPRELRLVITSAGPAFDLEAALAAAAARDPLEEGASGGLGLPLVAALFDEVRSEHEAGRGNRITLRKAIAG